jgi:hypothetical protein
MSETKLHNHTEPQAKLLSCISNFHVFRQQTRKQKILVRTLATLAYLRSVNFRTAQRRGISGTCLRTRHQRLLIHYSNADAFLGNKSQELVSTCVRILHMLITLVMNFAFLDFKFRVVSQEMFCKLLRGLMKWIIVRGGSCRSHINHFRPPPSKIKRTEYTRVRTKRDFLLLLSTKDRIALTGHANCCMEDYVPGVQNPSPNWCVCGEILSVEFFCLLNERDSIVVEALCYKPEGHGFDTRRGDFFNLPNPSGRTRPWGLLGL